MKPENTLVTREEIIDKCNKWMRMFKKEFDVFKTLVLSDKYRLQNLTMTLACVNYYADNGGKGKSLNLDITKYGDMIFEGITISIDERNEDIFRYILAETLDYYINQVYEEGEINIEDYNGVLYSNYDHEIGQVVPFIARLGCLRDDKEYDKLINRLMINYNAENSSGQVIDAIKNMIGDQTIIDDLLNSSLDYSEKQYDYISTLNNNGKCLTKNKRDTN